ncbi:MAG TPA: Crp/Fnr family transcriptional regulator [Nitrospira sp.]|nr:Crp/Fnr family transcriptional regulator [Nitrospira sp.]
MRIPDSLSTRFLAALQRVRPIRRRTLKDKMLVYESFLPGRTYAIEVGYVRIVSTDASGRYSTRSLLGRGALLGDLPFGVTTFQNAESALANGKAIVLEVDRASIERASRNDQDLRQGLLETYGLQLHFLDRRLQWQLTSPLRRRVAMVLTDLMCFEGQPCNHGVGYVVDVRLTHEELSELVGASRPNVSAIMKTLRDQGVLSYRRTYVCVKDLGALGRIAAPDVMHVKGLRDLSSR